jgi:hypothetical protein
MTANFGSLEAGGGGVSVLLNTTASGADVPSFAEAATFAAGTTPNWVAAADVDGDGRLDVVTANTGTVGIDGVSVLVNSGGGAGVASFAAPVHFGAGVAPLSVAIADVNGDGRPDLAASNVGTAGPDGLSVLLNATDR